MKLKTWGLAGLRRVLLSRGFEVVPLGQLNAWRSDAALSLKHRSLRMLPDDELRRAVNLLDDSMSQLNQDLFVLHELGWKRDGFFVEFGATDGRALSNTWLLEKRFGWTGILAEPARRFHRALENAGRDAAIDFSCVAARSGETAAFDEASWGEFSTIARFTDADDHPRQVTSSYSVETVSLDDLLDRHRAPEVIDYLSIDTEGSEYEILAAFDFARRRFRCITCEHNFTPNRERIHALLTRQGYERKFEEFSRFDDWYVLANEDRR
jgi:FkbM family methyltransferase